MRINSRFIGQYAKGFTLVELMIVIAILGVILLFAVPSYNDYVVRSKRADGMSQVLNAASTMERFRAANMTYDGAAVGTTIAAQIPPNDNNPYYNVALSNLGRTTYTITATPINSMAGQDGPLTIDQAGRRTWTDKDGVVHNCWPKSGGTC